MLEYKAKHILKIGM